MIRLAEEFFDAKNDPEQIAVDEAVMEKLRALDAASLGEEHDDQGPIAWVLAIPTTEAVMRRFLQGAISERQLLDETKAGQVYDAIYLCSALVLPEHRQRGIAKKVTLKSIREICTRHPIKNLFYWPFSEEGRKLAESVAALAQLPLLGRASK